MKRDSVFMNGSNDEVEGAGRSAADEQNGRTSLTKSTPSTSSSLQIKDSTVPFKRFPCPITVNKRSINWAEIKFTPNKLTARSC